MDEQKSKACPGDRHLWVEIRGRELRAIRWEKGRHDELSVAQKSSAKIVAKRRQNIAPGFSPENLNRYLTDAVIAWKDIWVGSIVTSLQFSLGKRLIGMYSSHTAVTSPFGAAGSLAAILIWLYFSAQIFLFGAELTKAYAGRQRIGLPQK